MDSRPTRREFLGSAVGATAALAVADPALGQATGQDWPMAGYDQANTGHNPATSGPATKPGARWDFETGDKVGTSPAVVDGTVYVGSRDGFVYAVDAESGEERWRFETGGQVQSSPTVADGTVYIGSDDGILYAIEAAGTTGTADREVWRFETGGSITAAPAVQYADPGADSPAVEAVYVGSWDGRFYRVDATSGEEDWQYRTGDSIDCPPAFAPPADGGTESDPTGTVYVGSDDNRVYAFDAESGEARWAVPTGGRVSSAPTVVGERVYVGSFDQRIYALDTANEEIVWDFDTGGIVVSSPAVADEKVIVGSRTRAGTVYALDVETGEPDWRFDTGNFVNAQPAVGENRIYVSTLAQIHALSFAGEERWSLDAPEPGPPAISGSRLYVGTDRRLYSLAAGAEGSIGGTDGPGQATGSDGPLADYRFLLWPVSAIAGVGSLLGIAYVAKRTGVLDWIEQTADSVPSAPPPSEREPTETDEDDPSRVWELVLDDVMDRAEHTETTATEDLVVTKYVDSDTLDSPVVAYEVESYRDDPATIELTEPLAMDDPDDASRPKGDKWVVGDETIRFETVIESEDRIRTIVGRPDVAEEDVEDLQTQPSINVSPD